MDINATSNHQVDFDSAAPSDLVREVAQLIVSALNLEVKVDELDPQAPLYGEGLGLDSVDILEIALVVSKRFGFQLRSDTSGNAAIFASLTSLTQYISAHRTV